jgi:hypothetical protein
MQPPVCRHCGSDKQVKLRRRINGNGSTAVIWFCLACNKGAEMNEPAIAHDKVRKFLAEYGKTIDDLKSVTDYTTQSQPCVICGAPDTEFNHWLPQMFAEQPEIKPEWDVWANVGAPLCRHHHALWHRIVTPYMPGIGQSRT